MYQKTSKSAYLGIQDSISERQHLILEALNERGQASNMELAKHLGWEINRVTPRIFELRTKGLVTAAIKRKCQITGNTCIAWRPV
jgi:DNA-binding MarR family transcriptional regulator|tara:strand:+ start:1731 stop:1985 length:255 start_codon:yes stop_codon:yes gene_type:complete